MHFDLIAVPGPPERVTLVAGARSINASWTQPLEDLRNGIITGYKLTYFRVDRPDNKSGPHEVNFSHINMPR